MLDETFYIDGVAACSVGIRLQKPVEFSEAIPVYESYSIPGRNGDLVFENGNYENRNGTADCYCLQHDVEKAITSAGWFLMGKKGYRRLETSDDPDHYWMARVENSPQIAQRMRKLAPFEILFNCKPQRFVRSGEIPVNFSVNGSLINEYGFDALPLIVVYGNAPGKLNIGEYSVEIKEIDSILYLDSETQNAYNKKDGNKNQTIQTEQFPILVQGENTISFTGGIERVIITPRWWEL